MPSPPIGGDVTSGGSRRPDGPERHASIPDLTLLVREGEPTPVGRTFTLELDAPDPALGCSHRRFGPVTVRHELPVLMGELFAATEGLRHGSARARAEAERRLEARGAELARDLLPAELMDLLWDLVGRAWTLQIVSDEPQIPWELMKLRRKTGGRWEHGPFLCQGFAVSRWLPGADRCLDLPLRRLALVVAGDGTLPAVDDERAAIEETFAGHGSVDLIPPEIEALRARMSAGDHDGWHFCGHGRAQTTNPAQWAVMLAGDDTLTPEDLAGPAGNLGASRPLVFLNACHSGRGGRSFAGLGGWPASVLAAGAGAFIGSWWAVDDRSAAVFASAFYAAFLGGESLAEAVWRAREELRRRNPGDPIWLAYVVYGTPSARCGDRSRAPSRPPTPSAEASPRPLIITGEGPPRPRRPRRSRRLLASVSFVAALLLAAVAAYLGLAGPATVEDPVLRAAVVDEPASPPADPLPRSAGPPPPPAVSGSPPPMETEPTTTEPVDGPPAAAARPVEVRLTEGDAKFVDAAGVSLGVVFSEQFGTDIVTVVARTSRGETRQGFLGTGSMPLESDRGPWRLAVTSIFYESNSVTIELWPIEREDS